MSVEARGDRGAVLVLDDDPLIVDGFCALLEDDGFVAHGSVDVDEALGWLGDHEGAEAVLVDLYLGERSGFDVMQQIRGRWPETQVLVVTGQAAVSTAIEAMRQGAFDYLVKPVDPVSALSASVQRAVAHARLLRRNRYLERQVDLTQRFRDVIAVAPAMRAVLELTEAVAPTDATVLVLGESGTGKELIARGVHARGRRAKGPFVSINCAALTESVVDSELFGHAAGAFTGAKHARAGLFVEASGGTIFLDEVGELPLDTQARLLRVLQEGELRPVGANHNQKVDVRIIAATNRELTQEIQAGAFRKDLFYRLNVFAISLPPLRERAEDVPVLCEHFLMKHGERLAKPGRRLEPRALDALCGYAWPGNVRELENTIERALILVRDELITLDLLPPALRVPATATPVRRGAVASTRLDDAIRSHIVAVLEDVGYRIEGTGGAAELLGLPPGTLRSQMRRFGITRPPALPSPASGRGSG